LSHFEYISVAVSLIYSLILARLLGALPAALRPGARYWVHTLWVVILLIATVDSWWDIWSYREVDWSPVTFVSLLGIPSIIYLRATVLLGEQPREVASWRAHYYDSRRPFFLLQFVGALNFVGSYWLIAGVPRPPGTLAGSMVFAGVAVVAAISAAPRLHGLIAVASLLAFTTSLVIGS